MNIRSSRDVVVLGGGAIGSAIAWRCAQRGLSVAVADPEPGRGAWHTAAGMLAPRTELHYAESALLRLNLGSLFRYPDFVAELTDATGMPTGYVECGTVEVAWDGADLRGLADLQAFGDKLGLTSRLLTGTELHALESALSPGLPGALLAEDDHQVDPRLLHAALLSAGGSLGVEFFASGAGLLLERDRVTGVTLDDGTAVPAGTVVLAAGAWSARVAERAGLAPAARPGVRPVKGQTVRLRFPGGPPITRVVRGRVKGSPVYVVPRQDGELVVGASSEETGFDRTPRAGAVYELLRDAQSLLPELGEAQWVEVCTGLRPGSPDNAPIIGRAGIDGLVYATGHYRNGILLTPITADGVAELLSTGQLPAALQPFTPDRLQAASTPAPARPTEVTR